MPSAKELAKALAYQGEIRNTPQNKFLGGVANFLAPVSEFADRDKLPESIPLLGGMSFADLSGLKGTESLVRDMSYGKSPIRGATLNTVKVDPRLLDVAAVSGAMIPVGKAALREVAKQVQNKTGIIGRNVIDPRMSVVPEGPSMPDTAMGGRVVQAPKEISAEKRFKSGGKSGEYRGTEAFGGISPQKLGAMRTNYLDRMREGVSGRMWYDDSSNDISRWTGGNPEKSDLMANMLATTSSGTPVGANLMYANKAWNQNLTGAPFNTGKYPTAMGKSIAGAMDSPQAAELGLKRSPFSAGLSVDWRGPEFASRATHDIHDARAWGIKDPATGEDWSKGIGAAGHRFLDDQADWVTKEANKTKLGGAENWTPYRAQAAAWVAQKALKEGVPISTSSKHYGSFAPEYQGVIPREWTPGSNTGHLPELQSATDVDKLAYANAMEDVVSGREGVDKLSMGSGALTDRTFPNFGMYEGDTNPGYSSVVNVGKEAGSQSVDAASQKVMDAIAAAHGLLGTQKQVATNYLGLEVPVAKAGGIRFPGTGMTDKDLYDLQQKYSPAGADVFMRDPAGGARALTFDESKRAGLAKALKAGGLEPWQTSAAEHRAASSSLLPMSAPASWSSKPFIEAIDRAGPTMSENISKTMQPMAGEILNKASDFAKANNWTSAEWFKPMMEGLRDGGIPRLKELVEKGIVPVFAGVGIINAFPSVDSPPTN